MSRRHVLGSMLASLVFPGFGQGLAYRRNRMMVFAIATVATTFAILVSVWCLPLALAVRIGAALDAFFVLRRHHPPNHRAYAAIAVVIGAISGGTYKLALHAYKIPSSSMYPTLEIGDHVYVDQLSLRWRAPERGEVVVFDQPCGHIAYVKRVIAIGGDTVEVRCNVVYVNGTAIPNDLVAASDSYRDFHETERRWLPRLVSRYRETHGGHTYFVFHDPDRPERDRRRDALDNSDARDFPQRDRMLAPSCQQGDFYGPRPGSASQPIGKLVVTKPVAKPCEQQAHFIVPANALFVMGDNRNNANDSRYWGAVSVDAVLGRLIGVYWSAPPGDLDRSWSRVGGVQ